MPVHDPSLEHQIQIKMLGNSGVYVTCNCLVRMWNAINLTPNKTTGWKYTRRGARMHDDVSLGDFPVGTSIDAMMAVYDAHLKEAGQVPDESRT